MRLFIAINFDDITKQKISDIQNKLRQYTVSANFTRAENMHLTLIFLGETPSGKTDKIKKTMDEIDIAKFEIIFKNIGVFKREGDIWFISANHSDDLFKLQKAISSNLSNAGFDIEKRKFSPHITLARQVKIKSAFDKSQIEEELIVKANKIDLMKSERINGKLIYSVVHSKELNK